jgi:hypothetical protein
MNDGTRERTPVQARLAQVETSVSTAAAELSARHPLPGLRAALDELRDRLAKVHDRCH